MTPISPPFPLRNSCPAESESESIGTEHLRPGCPNQTLVRTLAGPRLAPPLCILSDAIRRSERAAQAYGRPCAALAAAAAAAEVAPPTAPAALGGLCRRGRRGGVARKDGRRLVLPCIALVTQVCRPGVHCLFSAIVRWSEPGGARRRRSSSSLAAKRVRNCFWLGYQSNRRAERSSNLVVSGRVQRWLLLRRRWLLRLHQPDCTNTSSSPAACAEGRATACCA